MNDYLQPDFYRFNQDSIQLINWVRSEFTEVNSILDLGSGCGVLGLELSRFLRPEKLTLVEYQQDFYPYLVQNVEYFGVTPVEIIISSFSQWIPETLYDLIVCNPPYYFSESGQPSKDTRRGVARSFIVDDWMILMSLVKKCLDPKGKAIFVLKNESKIENEMIRASTEKLLSTNIKKRLDVLLVEITHSC